MTRCLIISILVALLSLGSTAEQQAPEAPTALRFVVYYGPELPDLKPLLECKVAILATEAWRPETLQRLRRQGVEVLSYLSLTELPHPLLPEHLRPFVQSHDKRWQSVRFDPRQPQWREHVLKLAADKAGDGIDGFFLDTVDLPPSKTLEREAVAELVEALKAQQPHHKLLLNRGFTLLSRLGSKVDGVLIESASDHSYSSEDRRWVEAQCRSLQRRALPLYLLDYSQRCDPGQSLQQAQRFGAYHYLAPCLSLQRL